MGQLTRRQLITAGLSAVAAGSAAVAAARIAARYGLIPPDGNGLFGAGETLTYSSHRILTSGRSLAREFGRSDISKIAPVNGPAPDNDLYQRLADRDFAEWRLMIDGLASRPFALTLDDLKRLPMHSQITMHTCEEGWSFIAEWIGVRLSDVLQAAGISTQARYVVFYPFDEWWDSLDVDEAMHPQTLLAYGMNGDPLSLDHGAPIRLRVPRQLGYKSVKFLSRITVTDTLANVGEGLGSASAEAGYAWYAGI
jgi:DMSO/TMAO reductase YedYZ molybdopterin-dependent catalytic subunit